MRSLPIHPRGLTLRCLSLAALGTALFAGSVSAQGTQACESDADCADGRVCETVTVEECPPDLDTSCDEGQSDADCAAAAQALRDSECTVSDQDLCLGNWEIVCATDERCGEGFRCAASGNCEPLEPGCSGDADCAGGWSCASVNVGSCTTDTDGPCGEQELRCVPPVSTTPDARGVDNAGQSGSEAIGMDPGADGEANSGCSASPHGGASGGSAALLLGLFAAAVTRRRFFHR